MAKFKQNAKDVYIEKIENLIEIYAGSPSENADEALLKQVAQSTVGESMYKYSFRQLKGLIKYYGNLI